MEITFTLVHEDLKLYEKIQEGWGSRGEGRVRGKREANGWNVVSSKTAREDSPPEDLPKVA